MQEAELTVWGILVAVAMLLVVAYRSRLPYPILLVLGGLALGFVPGVPVVRLDPDIVLLVLLPPLLYAAAFFSSLRDLRESVKPISALAVGLVLVTTLAVGVVAHLVIGDLSWAAAFVLGAVVSPTDPVAATSILNRLHVPRRVVTIVEGESLVNDALALVLYKVAVIAVTSGSFSLLDAGGRFLLNAAGGIAIGLVVGFVVAEVRRRIDDPPTEITISIVTAYLAYLPAAKLGVSAVLAAVTAGIWLGWNAPWLASPSTRLQTFPVWQILVFVVNATLFMLLGLQLHRILDDLSGFSASTLLGYGALVSVVVIATRIVWVFALSYAAPVAVRLLPGHEPGSRPNWRSLVLISWTGMRGAVSLAAALAIPFTLDSGAAFPGRELIVFLTLCVILVTLLVQGLTLPLLIPLLAIEEDGTSEREEARARMLAAQAAIERIDELQTEDWVRDETADRARQLMDYRSRRFQSRYRDGPDGAFEERSIGYQRLQREILEAQRRAVIELRSEGRINDDVMHRIERDLDLEDSRLEI
ncbi:MAG: Na+/H+ antiporter [Conexibacter sp.]|nr:Na+/H+ antiporter [Conexibacter sp.]